MSGSKITFDYQLIEDLPPRAWLARSAGDRLDVVHGRSVETSAEGFFEGTWSGEAGLPAAGRSSTVLGSGILASKDSGPLVVPPSHTLEPLFITHASDGRMVAGNSFVAVLEAIGAELRADVPYTRLFGRSNRGIHEATVDIPTTGQPVTAHHFENLSLGRDGGWGTAVSPKPRERDFVAYNDYRDRLTAHVASAFANAAGHLPLATISSGYDSTACAAIGAAAGCRDAVTFTTGWAWRGFDGTTDSGETAAMALGLSVRSFDRLAYMQLDDAPEAEFFATGSSAEDVYFRSMEDALPRSMLLTGFWGGAAWRGLPRANISRLDLSGASMGEFRLRTDFIHLPVPLINGLNQASLSRLMAGPDFAAYRVNSRYDEPIARRIAEDAGVPRGSFAVNKMAASVRFHTHGLDAMSPAGRASFEAFCDEYAPGALRALPRQRTIGRRGRLALRTAHMLRADWLARGVAQRRLESVTVEPVLGSLLFRWGVARIRDRYSSVRGFAQGS